MVGIRTGGMNKPNGNRPTPAFLTLVLVLAGTSWLRYLVWNVSSVKPLTQKECLEQEGLRCC